jgi:hypothetical protein
MVNTVRQFDTLRSFDGDTTNRQVELVGHRASFSVPIRVFSATRTPQFKDVLYMLHYRKCYKPVSLLSSVLMNSVVWSPPEG